METIQYVQEFELQFRKIYGDKFLFLMALNEMDVMKFIPTSIQPTYLPYRELYNYKSAARFIAEYMKYEPLEVPDKYPTHIPSPANVLKWRAGDAFDFCTVLVSLLCGAGYDAYCVSGYAPRPITDVDQSSNAPPDHLMQTSLPPECNPLDFWTNDSHFNKNLMIKPPSNLSLKQKMALEKSLWFRQAGGDTALDNKVLDPEDDFTKIKVVKKPAVQSRFHEEQRKKKEMLDKMKYEEEMCSDSDEEAPKRHDEYDGRRLHCWVLIQKGSREVSEPFFIEPVTGQEFSIAEAPYGAVHFVWNHKNMHICMQHESSKAINWDLSDPSSFETVLPDLQSKFRAAAASGEDIRSTTESLFLKKAADGSVERVLDAPVSWSDALEIPRVAFEQRCYNMHKTLFYDKVTIELFAPYSQPDGMVQRITKYKDLKRVFPREIIEKFYQRVDKLQQRIREPRTLFIKEMFGPGREDALKSITTIENQRREFVFYPSRLDCLRRHVEIFKKKITQEFEGRVDQITRLSVTLDPTITSSHDLISAEGGDIPVLKMSQCLAPASSVAIGGPENAPPAPYLTEVKKVVFTLHPDLRIRVDYHDRPGSILQQSMFYLKEDGGLIVDRKAMELAEGKYKGKYVGRAARDNDFGGSSSATESMNQDNPTNSFSTHNNSNNLNGSSATSAGPERPKPAEPTLADAQHLINVERDCLVMCKESFKRATQILNARKQEESKIDMRRALLALERAANERGFVGGAITAAAAAVQAAQLSEETGEDANSAIMRALAEISRNPDGTIGITNEAAIPQVSTAELNEQLLLFHAQQQAASDGKAVSNNASSTKDGKSKDGKGDDTKLDSTDDNKAHLDVDVSGTVYRTFHAKATLKAQEEALKDRISKEEEDTGPKKADVLAPYLIEFGDKELTAAEADFVAKRCKADFRKRLLERAAIIQRRLEEEHELAKQRRAKLQNKRNNSNNNSNTAQSDATNANNNNAEERDFEADQQEAAFRIAILEHRLARHEALAVKKFAELERILAEHPRLVALHGFVVPGSNNQDTEKSIFGVSGSAAAVVAQAHGMN